MGIGALAGASVVGGLIQSRSAGRAAKAQAGAADRAANLQAEAARQSVDEQRRQFDIGRADLSPYRQTGYNALAAQNFLMGLGPQPVFGQGGNVASADGQFGGGATTQPMAISEQRTSQPVNMPSNVPSFGASGADWRDFGGPGGGGKRSDYYNSLGQPRMVTTSTFNVGDQTFDTRDAAQEYIDGQAAPAAAPQGPQMEYEGFEASPGYQFRLGEGQKQLERAAAARGMRMSSGTMKDFQRFGQGMASQEFGDYYNRLAGLSGSGQTATNTGVQLGQNFANNTQNALMTSAQNRGNAYMQAGQARARGALDQGQAFGGIINNLSGIYGAAQGGMFGANPGFGITPSPAGLAMYGYN